VALINACRHAEVLAEPRFSDATQRYRNASALNQRLWDTPDRTTVEWLALCGEISLAAVNSLADMFVDPHPEAVGFFRCKEHPTEGGYIEVRPPVAFSARADPDIGPTPLVGEHSDSVLADLRARIGTEPSPDLIFSGRNACRRCLRPAEDIS
jgi:crotonobetainyl-CoA:carnitine CoA-transferase CaiB-like acyl-CoA transferase